MRRRNERNKSEAQSPLSTPRRSRRRTSRCTPDVDKTDESDKHLEESSSTQKDSSPNRASSEEPVEKSRRGRSTRSSRAATKRRLTTTENKIDAITEEENGQASDEEDKEEEEEKMENIELMPKEVQLPLEEKLEVQEEQEKNADNEENALEVQKKDLTQKYLDEEDVEMREISACEEKSKKIDEEENLTKLLITGKPVTVEEQQEVATTLTVEPVEVVASKAITAEEEAIIAKEENVGTLEVIVKVTESAQQTPNGKYEQEEGELAHSENELQTTTKEKEEEITKSVTVQNKNGGSSAAVQEPVRTRKRKWLSKKSSDCKERILAISTDSLKNLIADVHPVPLSDVKLESSSEVEEVPSETNAREISSSPSDHERRRNSLDITTTTTTATTIEKTKVTLGTSASTSSSTTITVSVPRAALPMQNSPSPPRNQTSNVLYITNLVRPFTVMQLKGLLARTGKIVENGFWIDRIKSKCYVQYETDDEAIETRHALHGVRWPVSNPKCLNVDFGKFADMERAIQLSNDDAPKYEKEAKENFVSGGTSWTREHTEENDRKKSSKPIREWDVGKTDRSEKRDGEKQQRSPKENTSKEEKLNKNRRRERDGRKSRSLSPGRKVKKDEPPLRLLDDLFRKTRTTPCIYWLPLTPEQIAEKEAYRQKRIEDRKERIKQRELEREKELELERERERNRERERSRERDKTRDRSRDRSPDRSRERRRNRSSDRRRSRSRDRRRY